MSLNIFSLILIDHSLSVFVECFSFNWSISFVECFNSNSSNVMI